MTEQDRRPPPPTAAAKLDVALPSPHRKNWREALRDDTSDSPRMTSYQPPDGVPIPFIQKSFRFAGGQSKDTSEYPFGGMWSNFRLNEKPQRLTVEGYLRGPEYIAARWHLIEALRMPTDDSQPGYLDLPFWGRFPVVVDDNYEIAEDADEQGQCAFTLSFTRARVNTTPPKVDMDMEEAKDALRKAAGKKPDDTWDIPTLWVATGKIKDILQKIVGLIKDFQTIQFNILKEIFGIMDLVSQGIIAPLEYVQSIFNFEKAFSGAWQDMKNSTDSWSTFINRERNVLVSFLSAPSYDLSGAGEIEPEEPDAEEPAHTPRQEATLRACENLFRIMAFLVAAGILENMDITYKQAEGYWRLLEKLVESIDREDPDIYIAIQNMQSALSQKLKEREISRELTKHFSEPMPLLALAQALGCSEEKIRELNSIADSFVIEGDVIYV